MTLNKELKITDDKIKAIQSEYDEDREGAKILQYHWINMNI